MSNLKQKYENYYDLEIPQLIQEININKNKFVLLQFPDGLKQFSKQIVDELYSKTKAEYFIYYGTCYGGCDIPIFLKDLGFDLCVQWGHTNFIKKEGSW
ncbi:MAG: diphthamide synthesis protein [Nanoarchaeota archaeon]